MTPDGKYTSEELMQMGYEQVAGGWAKLGSKEHTLRLQHQHNLNREAEAQAQYAPIAIESQMIAEPVRALGMFGGPIGAGYAETKAQQIEQAGGARQSYDPMAIAGQAAIPAAVNLGVKAVGKGLSALTKRSAVARNSLAPIEKPPAVPKEPVRGSYFEQNQSRLQPEVLEQSRLQAIQGPQRMTSIGNAMAPQPSRVAESIEPWKMTQREYAQHYAKPTFDEFIETVTGPGVEEFATQAEKEGLVKGLVDDALMLHRTHVERAVMEGKQVPPQVLQEYQDLLRQQQRGGPPVPVPDMPLSSYMNQTQDLSPASLKFHQNFERTSGQRKKP